MCEWSDSNRQGRSRPMDFKSIVSTNFTTLAKTYYSTKVFNLKNLFSIIKMVCYWKIYQNHSPCFENYDGVFRQNKKFFFNIYSNQSRSELYHRIFLMLNHFINNFIHFFTNHINTFIHIIIRVVFPESH